MGKRKVFVKTDLTTAIVEYTRDAGGNVIVLPERVPRPISVIRFGQNASDSRTFVRRGLNTVDFGRFKNRDLGGGGREGSRFSGRRDQASGMWSLAL